jgi:hypothetical protein
VETILEVDQEETVSGGDLMRRVTYTDKFGYKKVALVRDTDSDELAPQGVPIGPPDLSLIDWEEVTRELSNMLVDRGILTYQDIIRQNTAVSTSVKACLTSKIVVLFKQTEGTS